MQISSNQWHYRWFRFWATCWNSWANRNVSLEKTDVCTYIRVSLVYPVLMIGATIFAVIAVGLAAITYPISILGVGGYLTIGFIVFAVVAIAATNALNNKFGWVTEEKIIQNRYGETEQEQKKKKKKLGFFKIFFQWIVDRHNKMCTSIMISKENKNV